MGGLIASVTNLTYPRSCTLTGNAVHICLQICCLQQIIGQIGLADVIEDLDMTGKYRKKKSGPYFGNATYYRVHTLV